MHYGRLRYEMTGGIFKSRVLHTSGPLKKTFFWLEIDCGSPVTVDRDCQCWPDRGDGAP
jgi:hypothetical protein